MKGIPHRAIKGGFIAVTITSVVMLRFGNTISNGETLYFGDATRGPADPLQVGPLSFSGRLATVAGFGLGADQGVGPIYELNRQIYYPVGSDYYSGPAVTASVIEGGSLAIPSDWQINSVTILPQFRVFSDTGVLLSDVLGFECYLSQGLPGTYTWIPASQMGTPLTLNFTPGLSSSWFFNLSTDWGPYVHYYQYRDLHLSEAQTLQWGFTVVSMDYSIVPEPATICIFGLGLAGVLCARRKRLSEKRWSVRR